MYNKFLEQITSAVDSAVSSQQSIINGLLHRMFWDDSKCDTLINFKLFEEFINIINNPISCLDENGDEYFMLNYNLADDFVKRFRDDLRKNKENI